jgi:hypothetical protein
MGLGMPEVTSGERAALRKEQKVGRSEEVGVAIDVLTAAYRLNVEVDGRRHIRYVRDKGEVGVIGINPEVAAILDRKNGPTVLLDATPDDRLLSFLFGKDGPEASVYAEDGAAITKRIVYNPKANRTHWLPDGIPQERGIGKALEAGLAGDAGRVGIVTYKKVAEELKRSWEGGEGPFAAILRAFRDRGGKLDLMYFGNLKGRDDLMKVDRLVLLGGHWRHVAEVRAMADYLGLDEEEAREYARQLARDELAQAAGRLRGPQRQQAAETIHFGTQLPTGWGRETILQEMPTGHPKNKTAMTKEEFKAARKAQGLTQAAWGKMLGKSEENVRRYENGRLAVPEEIKRAIDRLGHPNGEGGQ